MKLDQAPSTEECISALADGQLDALTDDTLALLAGDGEARDTWQLYQIVGEVLRTGAPALPPADGDFVARLRQRMAVEVEAALPSPPETPVTPVVLAAPVAVPPSLPVRVAANDGVFRWKLVAGLASVAAVGLLSWQLLGAGAPGAEATLARAPSVAPAPPALVAVQSAAQAPLDADPVLLRDPRTVELISAHRQVGGGLALQHPNGFVRNAVFEVPSR